MKKIIVALLATGLMVGCSTAPEKSAVVDKKVAVKNLNNNDLYVVYHDGRMNVFYDADLYKEFLSVGETAYRKTFIGAGPKGETIMYS
jgi:translation elongation factor P/translation initiation factor 5A